MATKKTVKKTNKPAAVKKAPVAKKTAAKTKSIKVAPMKSVAAPTACVCPGGCACRPKSGWFKKLFWLVVIFALGFAACKFCCGKHDWKKHRMHWTFVNGCMDTSRIKCPAIAQKIMTADLNNDGCISKEELRAWKKTKFAGMRGMHKKSKDGGCPYSNSAE